MGRHISLIFVLIFIFAGCAKTNQEYNALRNNKATEVKTFATLPHKTIEEDDQCIVSLGDKDKEIINLDGQKTFASKLLLPKMNTPFSLAVSSSSPAGFFAPKVFFLDAQNQIVHTTEAKNLKFDRGSYKGTIFINTDYGKINSIIITQDLKELHTKQNVKYVNPKIAVLTIGFIPIVLTADGGDKKESLENAYGGDVKLLLKAYKPTVLGVK